VIVRRAGAALACLVLVGCRASSRPEWVRNTEIIRREAAAGPAFSLLPNFKRGASQRYEAHVVLERAGTGARRFREALGVTLRFRETVQAAGGDGARLEEKIEAIEVGVARADPLPDGQTEASFVHWTRENFAKLVGHVLHLRQDSRGRPVAISRIGPLRGIVGEGGRPLFVRVWVPVPESPLRMSEGWRKVETLRLPQKGGVIRQSATITSTLAQRERWRGRDCLVVRVKGRTEYRGEGEGEELRGLHGVVRLEGRWYFDLEARRAVGATYQSETERYETRAGAARVIQTRNVVNVFPIPD